MSRLISVSGLRVVAAFLLYGALVSAQSSSVDPASQKLPNPNPVVTKGWGPLPDGRSLSVFQRVPTFRAMTMAAAATSDAVMTRHRRAGGRDWRTADGVVTGAMSIAPSTARTSPAC